MTLSNPIFPPGRYTNPTSILSAAHGGRSESNPCVFFTYSAKDGLKALPGAVIHNCSDTKDGDESHEMFEVYLGLGLLVDEHTDFDLADSIPIRFQRAPRDGWKGSMAFGISGSHNYDKYLKSAKSADDLYGRCGRRQI